MFTIDRTIKALLAAIAIFLGLLALRPLIRLTPVAWAQTSTAPSVAKTSTVPIIGYRTTMVSTFPVVDKVRGVQVIDSAQAFIVQYDNRLEVYRVNEVPLTAFQIK